MSRRWYRPGLDAECVRWLASTGADGGTWVRDGAVTGWPRQDHAAAAHQLSADRAARAFASSGGALRVSP